MLAVGFEPTRLASHELESCPLDHSGKLAFKKFYIIYYHILTLSCFINCL